MNGAIAIVGMACELPGAHSPGELWENVLAGRRFFRKAPAERLPAEYFDADPLAPGKSYCDQMAVLSGWAFDPLAFRLPPVTFGATDLAHWLALATAQAALRSAGLDPARVDRTRVGVILGNSLTGEFSRSHTLRFRWPYVERSLRRALGASRWSQARTFELLEAVRAQYEAPLPEISEDSLPGNMANIIAGRICNYYDFGAGGFTIDGACASSLLSVALACEALARGDMDVALAGGVDLSLDPFEIVGFAKAHALAAEDIRPYDERAEGMLTGEGCGILVLTTEAHARTAGYQVLARVRGWGYSSDGAGGITAPEVAGQLRALRRAYARAGYDLGTVGLIEGHGTGTPLGDRVEITALRQELEASPGDRPCWLGSVKGNIGHCKAAAGVAGLIKTVLALQRKILPPTANCERPHPAFGPPGGRLRPSLAGQVWARSEVPRRAAVSAFGFGGANAHVTLEETDPAASPDPADLALLGSAQSSELIALAGNSVADLRQQIQHLLPLARRLCRAELTDLAAALARAPLNGPCRLGLVVDSPWRLAEKLQACATQLERGASLATLHDPACAVWAGLVQDRPRWVALFPGQGAQRLNMGHHWRRRFPFVRAFYEEVAAAGGEGHPLGVVADKVFRDVLGADEATRTGWENELRDTRLAQPAIVLSSLATQQVLTHFGLVPDYALGHSLGEISALAVAGVVDALTAVRLAALRGRVMASLALPEPGSMAALAASPDQLSELLRSGESVVTIANYNGPHQTVVSGPSAAVRELVSRAEQRGLRGRMLAVSHAFHSELVAPAALAFGEAIRAAGSFFPRPSGPAPATALREDRASAVGPSRAAGDTKQAPPARIISTVTGQPLAVDNDWPAYLADQIRRPVRFTEAVRAAAQTQPALWIEVGPGGALINLVRDILSGDPPRCFPTDLPGEDGFDLLNRVLACAWVLGFPVRLDRLWSHRFHRTFDVKQFNPRLIVNPCERPVEVPARPLDSAGASLAEALLPAEAEAPDFADYLARRAPFLRQLIALDYHHTRSASASGESLAPPRPEVAETPARPKPAAERPVPSASPGAASETRESLLAFALDWIAHRTGFPRHTLTPEKRLRDDLNLDSIKVGELALLLAQRNQRETVADPTAVANARIADLVESTFGPRRDTPTVPPAASVRLPHAEGTADGLGSWVRTFQLVRVKAPLPTALSKPLPHGGCWMLVAERGCARARALAEALEAGQFQVRLTDFDSLSRGGSAPPDLTVLIVLLPATEHAFHECAPTQFDHRVLGTATRLFQVFRWAGHGRETLRARGLVLRPVGAPPDPGEDLDGGCGLLRSLGWEYPEVDFKWVALPNEWPAPRWIRAALDELQTDDAGLALAYTPDGARWGEAARPTAFEGAARAHSPSDRWPLGPEDVVLATGGAKGVTCELALELGRRTGVRLALLGSSPPPGGPASPAAEELKRNLQRFHAEGLRHLYVQADVTELASVERAVREAERALGPVTGVLHGAGVTRLRSFREKSLEEFIACLRTKAQGLYHLLRVVPPTRLKAVHVVSSVLGSTGMMGQTDYALANAWLNGAIRSLAARHPHLHCLALGFSAWAETGLARRLGTIESLRARGVEPMRTADGVAAYGALLDSRLAGGPVGPAEEQERASVSTQHPPPGTGGCFVITGRLAPEFESRLYGATFPPPGRFLSEVRRWVPGTELIADATLAHRTDLYLPEHVFEGTALFPGVMALEAMVQAALACVGGSELPTLHAVRFGKPLVVPPDTRVVLRTLALADPPGPLIRRVHLALRSGQDGFRENLIEAEARFGEAADAVRPRLPTPLPPRLDRDPEDFWPVPLFQGKFFRRISSLRQLAIGAESLAEIQAPTGERYYAGFPNEPTATPCPVVRDACLQAGALILPPGALPQSIGELRFRARPRPGDTVVCRTRVRSQTDAEFVVDLDAFTADGQPLESMRGLKLRTTGRHRATPVTPPTPPLTADRLGPDLAALLPKEPLAVTLVAHSESGLSDDDKGPPTEPLTPGAAQARQLSERANRLAARRAAVAFARAFRQCEVTPQQVTVRHQVDGKPTLHWATPALADTLQNPAVSLADSAGHSMAVVGPAPLGVDLETVERRDCETWRGLLGDDGYALAQHLVSEVAEPFDVAATRVWTLLEAGKKAVGSAGRTVPNYDSALGGTWLAFGGGTSAAPLAFLSAKIDLPRAHRTPSVVTIAVGASERDEAAPQAAVSNAWAAAFAAARASFQAGLKHLQPLCAGDPDASGCAARHAEFLALVEDVARQLKALECQTPPAELAALRRQFQDTVLSFLEGSENFRHTLVKPLGYAGDFQLLDLLAGRQCASRGLAYHFDRAQLDAPASEACRQRIAWISAELHSLTAHRATAPLRLLDLGIGSAPIERELLAQQPGLACKVHAVDLEPAALEFAVRQLTGPQREVIPWRWDLRDPAVMPQLAAVAAEVEVCLAVGLLEALTDSEALALLQTLLRHLPPGARLYTENFIPTHPTRPLLEWFLDFHLAYRSSEDLARLLRRAGADPTRVVLRADPTGCLTLVQVSR